MYWAQKFKITQLYNLTNQSIRSNFNFLTFQIINIWLYLNIIGKKAYIGIIPEVSWAIKAQNNTALYFWFFVKWQCDARCPWRLSKTKFTVKKIFLSQKNSSKQSRSKITANSVSPFKNQVQFKDSASKMTFWGLCPCVFTNFLRFLFHFIDLSASYDSCQAGRERLPSAEQQHKNQLGLRPVFFQRGVFAELI